MLQLQLLERKSGRRANLEDSGALGLPVALSGCFNHAQLVRLGGIGRQIRS